MSVFQRGDVSIYYEVRGTGFPLLLLALGGMNSTISFWNRASFNPIEVFSGEFSTIAMDQRNAGSSSGPLDMADPWGSYADDQLELMYHLGIDKFHVLGHCIGGPFILSLVQRAPERVASAVIVQSIGISDENREELPRSLYTRWAAEQPKKRSDVDLETAEAFGARMFSGDFVFSVSREFVKSCTTPLLVLPGDNNHHPKSIGLEIQSLAQNAELLEEWRAPSSVVPTAVARIKSFLKAHTPK